MSGSKNRTPRPIILAGNGRRGVTGKPTASFLRAASIPTIAACSTDAKETGNECDQETAAEQAGMERSDAALRRCRGDGQAVLRSRGVEHAELLQVARPPGRRRRRACTHAANVSADPTASKRGGQL